MRVQDDHEESLYDGLVIVFGEPFCFRWLLPIPGGALVRKQGTVDVTPRLEDERVVDMNKPHSA